MADFDKPLALPPLRVNNQEDDHDQERLRYFWERFDSQDGAYRLRDRQIEENIRMLAGQQWLVYHHLLGWKDVTHWMTEDEKLWRMRPVFNRVLPWFILTHARMTENEFICTFEPGPDRSDANLAELLDILYKAKWRDVGMTDAWSRCAAWIIVSGVGYVQTLLDPNAGEWRPWIGQARVPLVGTDGLPILGEDGQQRLVNANGVPFDEQGEPAAVMRADGQLVPSAEPHWERAGDLTIGTYSPLEVRGAWGPIPWYQQKIHMVRTYHTPEEVFERWGVEVEPDVIGSSASQTTGIVERVLFGSGFFGAANAKQGAEFSVTGGNAIEKEGLVCIQTTWMAPSKRVEGMEDGPDKPGGRLTVQTRKKVIVDGERPVDYKYTSPIRCFRFVDLPGRPSGTTPQEMMNSPQKAYNQGWKQILENRSLSGNPQKVYDLDSGLTSDKIDNRPGRNYGVRMKKGVKPIEYLQAPTMSADVWRSQAALREELSYEGATHGTEPQQFSKDASGELVRELRFNDDRFLGPTMRRAAEEMGRMIEDWMVLLPVVYDQQTIIKYTGEDNVARTIVLMPEILRTSTADVVPDLESMLPEGRGERRARIYKMWKDGAWGDPESPEALRHFHELSRFPHMSRTAKPGGIHWTTAEQENGELLNGGMPPVWEWYDDKIHVLVHTEFMASPEFRRLPDNIKLGFVVHRQQHVARLQEQMAQQLMAQQAMEDRTALAQARAGTSKQFGLQAGPSKARAIAQGPPAAASGAPGGEVPTAAGAQG